MRFCNVCSVDILCLLPPRKRGKGGMGMSLQVVSPPSQPSPVAGGRSQPVEHRQLRKDSNLLEPKVRIVLR